MELVTKLHSGTVPFLSLKKQIKPTKQKTFTGKAINRKDCKLPSVSFSKSLHEVYNFSGGK